MKKLAFATSAFLLAFTLSACAQSYTHSVSSGVFSGKTVKASDNYVTKQIRVKNFDEILVSGSVDVTYTQRPGKPEVEIYTSENVVDLLDIRVKNGCLNVGFKKNVSVKYNKLEVRVSSEDLNQINIVGSGDFEFANGLKTDNLSITVAGSSDVKGENIRCSQELLMSVAGSGDLNLENVTAITTKASVAGSGTIRMNGSTQDANYSVAGSGDLLAEDYVAQNVDASVAGSGDIKCHAVKYLKAHTNGSGEIGYKGDPKVDYSDRKLYKL